MYAILLSMFVVFPVTLVHVFAARIWSLMLAVAFVAIPLACGGVGTLHGRSQVDAAVEHADIQYVELLRTVGYREASRPITFGLLVVGLALLPIAIGEVRRVTRDA